MSGEPLYTPRFANDDPLRSALAMDAEIGRIMVLARTEPERSEAEFQKLLDEIKRIKAERERQPLSHIVRLVLQACGWTTRTCPMRPMGLLPRG